MNLLKDTVEVKVMNSIKIAHEAPKSIFREVQNRTDYDYCLVHLLEEDSEYLNLFKDAKNKGREIILDNSIFELGEAFDSEKYAYWIETLKPDWYIIPDVLEDFQGTLKKYTEWEKKYNNLPGKRIGVIQGKTFSEIASCYSFLNLYAKVDMIAISFDYSYYLKSVPHPNKYVSWTLGRVKLLADLERNNILSKNIKHHLLGSSLYWEGSLYKDYPWIYSIDTSNPVMFGVTGQEYQGIFTQHKPSQKLFTIIDEQIEPSKVELIYKNIHEFRKYWTL